MPPLPLDNPNHPLSLNLAGVSSLLGGDDAVSAMIAVHIYGNRRWLGWHNTPGSFQLAKRLNTLATSSPSNFPSNRNGVHFDFTTLLEPDRGKGPKFRAVHSGAIMEETGYLATLFMKECTARDSEALLVPGRRTLPVSITIADLDQAPACEMHPVHSSPFILLLASIPVITSICAFSLCVAWEKWCAASLIVIGIAASGLSGLVVGLADFTFTHPDPAKGSPAGDGILSSGNRIVLLRGTEGAVNSITRGIFFLRFSNMVHYNFIGFCSFFFYFQGFTQLFLVPLASLSGQVIFHLSLGVSAICHLCLSSLDKEKIHRKMLFEQVLRNPTLTKYTFGTYTTAVVFILLVLKLKEPNDLLNALLPNDTKAWRRWKETMLEWLHDWTPAEETFRLCKTSDLRGFTQNDKELLEQLYRDARSAFDCYRTFHCLQRITDQIVEV